ncbi:MAG: right-handed parallel beta-helix repeat-containing protein, partial [Akkermansiaceae bacterium]
LTANGRNGLFAIEPLAAISVQTTRSEKNREVGFYFSGANGVNIVNCHVRENFLGGILFDQGSKAVSLKGNKITKNGEVGLVFEMGVEVVREIENKVEGNLGKQIWRGAVFPTSSGEDTVSPPPPPPPLEVEESDK